MSLGYGIAAVLLAWVILFVSFSRVTLSILADQGGCVLAKQQLIPIAAATFADPTKEETYTLPNVSTLPTSPFYGFKVVRDYLWLLFSPDPLAKSKMALFIGDKNVAEMYALIKGQRQNEALQAAIMAKNRLYESGEWLDKSNGPFEERRKVQSDLFRAGLAYRQMVESLKSLFDLDQIKYSVLIKQLDDWNQKQAAKINSQTY